MALLNYTSNVDADKTAQEIARCLSLHGAKAVLTEYDEKEQTIKSISFKISLNDTEMSFRLPCDWKPVFELLLKDKPIDFNQDFTAKQLKRYEHRISELKLQSVRTAWRIVKDWVEAQMALVETQMVTTQQVFLPYAIMRDGRTLSEGIVENPNLLLGN